MSASLPQLSLSDIQPKMELKGVVTKIELMGAFVDVGIGRDALLHISRIKPGGVNNVQDFLTEGQEITVWVHAVDREQGRVSLTMIKPPSVGWDEIVVGQVYGGEVVRIEKFGVFVDIGAGRPGLVHVSELAADHINTPGDLFHKGDTVQVKVLDIDPKKNRMNLSIKAVTAASDQDLQPEETEGDETPTAMALALQRAFKGNEESSTPLLTKNASRQNKARQRSRQDDILRRTLEQHDKS